MTETNPIPFHAQADIIDQILKEVKRAKQKHPNFPDHIVARAAIVAEEAGELVRAALNWKYEKGEGIHAARQKEELVKEAIQTAATCVRFLESIQPLFQPLKTIKQNDNRTESAENSISEDLEG